MKIAFSGKGGVGKSAIATLLSLAFMEKGYRVLAIDADPSPHLARLLEIEDEITPLAEMRDLLAERAEKVGPYYSLNPKIEDLPEKFMKNKGNINLMVLGAIREAGAGCACPEQTVLRRLMGYLILKTQDVIIVDMEAGVEHFGRGTVVPMDVILVITKPYRGSIETSKQILRLAEELKLKKVFIVGNGIRNFQEEELLKKEFGDKIIAFLPEDKELEKREIEGKGLWDYRGELFKKIEELRDKLLELKN